jgi:cytochrome c heme-lyase
VYNVYNQRIDTKKADSAPKGEEQETAVAKKKSLWNLGGWGWNAKNNMPLEPNQQPSAGQRKAISTERQDSTIPKGGTNFTWQYPSPQMFFNALTRKDKAEGVEEDDMENVVFFHNGMNEITWDRVRRWEALHHQECSDPKLARFRGRPHDLSPLARIRSWFTGEVPFDRHDWYVDRCGREVRYVIDFYFDEDKAGTMEAFTVEARPALDDLTSCVDRLKMNIYTVCAKYGLPCPISGHEPTVLVAKPETTESGE